MRVLPSRDVAEPTEHIGHGSNLGVLVVGQPGGRSAGCLGELAHPTLGSAIYSFDISEERNPQWLSV
jgi:hypothetical protein